MKIAFLNRFQDTVERGAETFVKELALRLSKQHQVDILTGKEADSLKKVLAGKYDIVIPINGRLQSLKVSLGRLIGKYKLLITGHSGIGRDDIWNIAICKPDVFVALTDYMAKWAKKWAWGSKVVKISNGIDLEKFKPQGEKIDLGLPKPIILSVGALTWYKYHEKVIKAVGEMGYGSVLIIGNGPEKQKLKELGNKILDERFKIITLPYKDMPTLYRSCNLFTLPSWSREAFGIVYLEAMASGLGVVAPDDASRREIVGNGGLFTDVDNPSAYAVTVRQALEVDWSKKAREQAKNFSWEKIARKYEELMLDMINKFVPIGIKQR